MSKVLKEAETRDIRSVYTFVRVDNKVYFNVLDSYMYFKMILSRPGLLSRESSGWCPKDQVSMTQPWRLWRKAWPGRRKRSKITDQFDLYCIIISFTKITYLYHIIVKDRKNIFSL